MSPAGSPSAAHESPAPPPGRRLGAKPRFSSRGPRGITPDSGGRRRLRSGRGITLLETLLAIALTAIVLYFISTGIQLTLRMLDREQLEIERSHLARVLLEQIASDLRATVYALPEQGGAASVLPSSGSAPASGASGPPGGGGPSGPAGPAGPTPAGSAPPNGPPGPGAGSPPNGPPSSSSSPPSPSSQNPPDGGQPEGEPARSSGLGLVGTPYALQIDACRHPRIDQYREAYDKQGTVQLPSGVRTVRYELRRKNEVGEASAGLYRWELDCQVARLAIARADWQPLESTAKNLAPEVTQLEFRYYDGYRWWTTWDSAFQRALPVLVEISVVFDSVAPDQTDRGTAGAEPDEHRYRLWVRLPAASMATPLDEPASGSSGDQGGPT